MFPTPGERALVEERRLDRRAARSRAARRARAAVKAASSGSVAEPRVEVRLELARLEQEPRAEAPDVAVGDVRSVV